MPRANDTSPPSMDQQIRELQAAHWIPATATIWVAPDGAHFRGPHGAWKAMKARERMAELGITDQDIYETMPPKPEDER